MSSALSSSRHGTRCPRAPQSTISGAVRVFANVTGGLDGRIRSRAQTAGLVVQRSPGARASVTGGDAARAPLASRRAQTAGFVVQRGAAVATFTASWRGAGVARAARWAFRRAHTAGFVVQRSAAALSPGAAHIRAPSRAGSAQREKPRLHAGAGFASSVLQSWSVPFIIIPITSLQDHPFRGRELW